MGRFIKITVAGLLVLAILMVFSQAGIRRMETWARERPDSSVGQSLPYTLGSIAYFTFRYELAKDILETNIDTWPNHTKNTDAEFRVAMCLEKMEEFPAAVEAFEAFALEYGGDPRADSAMNRAAKIKAVQLNNPFGD